MTQEEEGFHSVNLSMDDKIRDKVWKTRLAGYQEAIQSLQTCENASDPVVDLVGCLLMTILSDTNAISQEKGIEVILLYLQKFKKGGKQTKEMMSVLVLKYLCASKIKTKEIAQNVILSLVELGQGDIVVDELLKGTSLKNPKTVGACILVLTEGLAQFGPVIVDVKKLINVLPVLVEDRDKQVRDNAKNLIVEIYSWLGETLKPKLTFLKPCQLTELETDFAAITSFKQQPKRSVHTISGLKSSSNTQLDPTGKLLSHPVHESFQSFEAINVLVKLPTDFYEMVESKKWQERKQALDCLEKILDYPRFEKGDYKELVRCLAKVISKDSNIAVSTGAVKCVTKLATGLKSSFHSHSNLLLPMLLEKFKEKKTSVVLAVRDAVDAIFLTLTFESMQNDLFLALESKNPSVQSETILFIARCLSKSNSTDFSKKIMKAYIAALVKTLNESDPLVRDSSAEALGTAMKLVGEHVITVLISDVDPIKMNKIMEFYEKADINPIEKMLTSTRKGNSRPVSADCMKLPDKEKLKDKMAESVTDVDLTVKISDQILNDLNDKTWSVRSEALAALLTIMNKSVSIKPNLGKLPSHVIPRISDSNPKIALPALEVCEKLARLLGAESKIHFRVFCRALLAALSDHRPPIRAAALNCLKVWTEVAGSKELFEGEIVPEALKCGSPSLRIELYTLLSEIMPGLDDNFNKEDLHACVPQVYANLEDRNADVRRAAGLVIPPLMQHVSYHTMARIADELKPVSRNVVLCILEKYRPDVPDKSRKILRKLDTSLRRDQSPRVENKGFRSTPSSRSVSRTREDSPAPSLQPLFTVNNMKQQRIIDEQKMKTLRWSFVAPGPEFSEALREQMLAAKVSKLLVSNMLHTDFKFHLKAIDSLIEDAEKFEEITSNLDLILKWAVLRFFDTNPAVILRVLEYLQKVFSTLIDNEFTLTDYEAGIFVPNLILKFGDPKDSVRERVRVILRQQTFLFSPIKIYSMLIDGTKLKNSRQRSECLEEIIYFIETFGQSVSPLNLLKEIAKHISDRDSAVRNASLNCIVQIWNLEGEKIFRYIGNLTPIESSLIDDKLKRVSKCRTVAETPTREKRKLEKTTPLPTPPVFKTEESPKELDSDKEYAKLKELIDIDISFLDKPVTLPEYLINKEKILTPSGPCLRSETLAYLTAELASTNINLAYQAASKLRVLLENPKDVAIGLAINQIVGSLNTQLRLVNSYSLEVYGLILPQTYRVLLRLIDDIFVKQVELAIAVDVINLQFLIQELVSASVCDTTGKFVDGGYSRIILIYISRIIENSDFTNIVCACIKLVITAMINTTSKLKTIEMSSKCLLKTVHVMKKLQSSAEVCINLDKILFECHVFFEAFPQYSWKDRPTNLPLKTVKALLMALVQWKGKDILLHLTLIECSSSSELCLYLKKLLKAKPIIGGNSRLTKAMSEHLSEVFVKIASDDHSREGLELLYEFKRENPHIDLNPYLSPTSKYFQEYVSKGLKQVEEDMAGMSLTDDSS